MSAARITVMLALVFGGNLLAPGFWLGCGLDSQALAAESVNDFSAFEQRIAELEARVNQSAATCEASTSCDCDCSCYCPGWFATVDYLYWQIERNDLAFSIFDPAGLGVPSAGSPIQSLDLGSTDGARLAFGRRTETGWEVGFRYTFMRASDFRSFTPGGGQVLAVLSSPSTGLTNADSVQATSDFTYDVYDIEAGHWVPLSESLAVRVFGGVRYAQIDHRLRAQYNGGAFVNGAIDVPTDVDAFGGRLGSTMHWEMTSDMSFFGTAGFTVAATDIDARRRESNAGVTVIDASRESNPIVPAVDLALGMRARLGDFDLAVGYEWTNWFNVVSPLEFSDNFNGGTIAAAERDLGLHGLFASLSYSY